LSPPMTRGESVDILETRENNYLPLGVEGENEALATFGSTAGSLRAACGMGVVTATENVRRRTHRVSQAAATVS
jgi:hypothetical protein